MCNELFLFLGGNGLHCFLSESGNFKTQAGFELANGLTTDGEAGSATPSMYFVSERLDRQAVACLSFSMADVFEALAAFARRAILDVLCERDGQTLFEICTRLTMKHHLTLTRQAISQHLDVLGAAGLLRTRREGRYKYHYLDKTPLNEIVKRWLTPNPNGGET